MIIKLKKDTVAEMYLLACQMSHGNLELKAWCFHQKHGSLVRQAIKGRPEGVGYY